ncbi:MAG: hypothetical protein IPN01_36475 [Deltaproteobacteria bacterium]|nr:hypothetical protein [Deltaproteobacteria bacterium]
MAGVAVLGATGMVGQRLVAMLRDHPLFELKALCASDRSAGRTLRRGRPLASGGRRRGLGRRLAGAGVSP